MNNRKLRFTLLSILVLVMISLVAFTGCKKNKDDGDGDSAASTQISIENSHKPRLIYVEGQDLDFSTGAITVKNGDTQTKVPLNDPRVTVTGYDKYTLGTQKISVSFEGSTTTLDVAVIARMTVKNAETQYFTHEGFNKNKGTVTIAKDDGTTFNVDMKNDAITLKSFDNSNAGSTNVTIKYTNGATVYECSFPVTVYAPDTTKIQFKAPNGADYFSHQSALNLSGGYIHLEAAKPDNFKKNIDITANMISGYDPSSVTDANKDEPVVQNVKVTYAGMEWTFPVNVKYSPIYVIESLESKVANINLELGEKQQITDLTLPAGAGAAAKEAIQRYFTLSSSDRALIDSELILTFARVAALYVNTNDYVNAINALNDAFLLDAKGNRTYVGKTVEAVQRAIEALDDPNSDYNATAAFMRSICSEFGTEQFNAKYKISDLTTPHTESDAQSISDELQHILYIYDFLKDMPADWSSKLSNASAFKEAYAQNIQNVVFNIELRKSSLAQDYNATNHSKMYAVITGWRADFFEIVYSYYYHVKDGGKDQIYSDLWGTVPAPGLLEEFRNSFNTAYDLGYQLTELAKTSTGNLSGTDISLYHYHYTKTIKLSNRIKASGNEVYTTIYNAINLDAYINVYLNAPSSSLLGYYDFVGPLVDSKNAAAVYDAYYEVFNVYMTTGQIASTSENRAKILALFNAMVDLTPSELHWFISSLSFNYHNLKGTSLIFNFNGSWQLYWLGQLMYGFFLQELPTNQDGSLHYAQAAFINLLQAMEIYPTAQFNNEALKKFKEYMDKVNTQYNELTSAEKSKFDSLAGKAFEKYNKIYSDVVEESLTLSTEMEAKFNDLYATLDEFFSITNDSAKMQLPSAYPTLMALYQKAKALYDELCEAAKTDSSVKHALNAKLYTLEIKDEDAGTTEIWKYTIDSYYYFVKYVSYGSILQNVHLDYVNALSGELIKLLPLFRAELNGTAYTGNIYEAVEIFRALDEYKLQGFYSIGADSAYFNAINRYAAANFNEQNPLNPGSVSAKIDELLAIYKEFCEMQTVVQDNKNYTNEQRSLACTAMIALYSKAKILYAEILEAASADEDVMNAVTFKLFAVTLVAGSDPTQATLDDYVNYMMLYTASLLSSNSELKAAATVENVQALLIKLIPLLKAEATGVAYTGNDILELLAALRALTPDETYAFYLLQGNLALYAELERYLEAQVSEAAKNSGIISALFNAEIYYSLYERNNEDKDSLEVFKTKMESAIEAYKTITDDDKDVLDELYYNGLLALYNELFPAQDSAE